MRFFCSRFYTDQIYIGRTSRLLSVFSFVLEFADLFKFFTYIQQWLTWHGVSIPANWVNAKWDSTSTESTRNDEIFITVGAFCVDSVGMETHSALTQLTWNLTPHWLSWQGDSLCVDSVCGRWIKLKQAYITSSGAFNSISTTWLRDTLYTCDGFWAIGYFPLLLKIGNGNITIKDSSNIIFLYFLKQIMILKPCKGSPLHGWSQAGH
jgi:hypothetical protein